MTLLPARYENPRLLGPDPLGERFQAFDRQRGHDVELVRATPQPGKDPRATGVLLERAYWALAACPHPALLGVLDFGVAPDGLAYATRPVPPGPALQGPLQEADLRGWLPDVVAALAAL
ncbi:MAG: hypothetical protein JWM80_5928, partial [Cyanobacteria bacterium RYN_339]|nr:hypothetical protein [Cyanobacteria bacterium RYN_339]